MRASLVFVFLVLVGPLGVLLTRAPRPAEESAPQDQFSAARALKDLEWIAAAPRPSGSENNRLVRERLGRRLRELGLEVTEQSFAFAEELPRTATELGETLTNIVGYRPGSGDGGIVLLMAHHDSVPEGPGAGDDGAAVAALLESLRAVSKDPPRRHDLMVLITDGEELGLVGAGLFLDVDARLDDVKAVFNFEARGAGGPSILFQVGPQSASLVDLFARWAPHPFGTSLAPAVYERMPNDTDFTLFLRRDVPGLNFAFLGGGAAYHQATDNIEELDLGSLQHHGENMTALIRATGDHDFDAPVPADREFFPLFGKLVVYPRSWTLVLGVVLTLVATATVARRARSSGRKLGVGLGSLFLVFLSVLLAGFGARVVAETGDWVCHRFFEERLARGSNLLSGQVGSVALWWGTVACALLLLAGPFHHRRDSIASGAVTLWALAAVALPIAVPGAGHLAVLGLLGVFASYMLTRSDAEGGGGGLGILGWIPAVLGLAPLQALFAQVGSVVPEMEIVLGGFGAGLLLSTGLPLLAAFATDLVKPARYLAAAACVGFFVRGVLFATGS